VASYSSQVIAYTRSIDCRVSSRSRSRFFVHAATIAGPTKPALRARVSRQIAFIYIRKLPREIIDEFIEEPIPITVLEVEY
jgi:hypothetical protein